MNSLFLKFVFLVLVVTGLPTFLLAADEGEETQFEKVAGEDEQNTAWFACEKDNECELVKNRCGSYEATHMDYREAYETWQQKSKHERECSELLEVARRHSDEQLSAECRNGQCVVREKRDAGKH